MTKVSDPLDPWSANALTATLNLDRPAFGPNDALPPFWHWLYFLEAAPRDALGRDGHPAPGWSVPATGLPRRMWAGGRIRFTAPLPLGEPASRESRALSVERKTGRSGPLAFVTMEHRISGAAGLALIEEQDLVYRPDPQRPDPQGSAQQGSATQTATPPRARARPLVEGWSCAWELDATVLFRYSALTFNGHRIHYDAAYAQEVEGYTGLVVHGPLLATLLFELATKVAPERFSPFFAGSFTFRAVSPITAGESFVAAACAAVGGLDLWIAGADQRLAMTAEIRWSASP
ncbi:MAG: hypothetical protein AAF565_20805 [Pseudomonadota bacterium]